MVIYVLLEVEALRSTQLFLSPQVRAQQASQGEYVSLWLQWSWLGLHVTGRVVELECRDWFAFVLSTGRRPPSSSSCMSKFT